ncbi:MAG: DUF2059 domain-containing protein [Myxococcota bacterium]|nr:DUF2059 domain-containing protein [Myxococcota bacterium]
MTPTFPTANSSSFENEKSLRAWSCDRCVRWSRAAAVCLTALLIAVPVLAEESEPEHDSAQIRKLIQLSGASGLGVQLLSIVEQQVIAALLDTDPNLSPEAGPIVRETVGEVLGADISGLVTRMIPAYARAFSPAEIDALVAFYESPAGSKLQAQLPTLMRASMSEGQGWVNEHREDMDSLLKKRLDTAGIAVPEG